MASKGQVVGGSTQQEDEKKRKKKSQDECCLYIHSENIGEKVSLLRYEKKKTKEKKKIKTGKEGQEEAEGLYSRSRATTS